VSALFFVNGFVVASWIPYIPMVKSRYAIGDGQLGFTLLAMVVGGVLGLPLAGWLVGWCGSRLVAVTAALGLSVMLPAPVLSPSVALASLTLLVFGTFNGVLDVSMNAQAIDVERRGGRPIMSSFHALFSLGGLVGAAVAGLAMFEHVPPVAHVVIVSMSMVTVVVRAPCISATCSRRAPGQPPSASPPSRSPWRVADSPVTRSPVAGAPSGSCGHRVPSRPWGLRSRCSCTTRAPR
jgi:predicted MFS family arabinose efflux permease